MKGKLIKAAFASVLQIIIVMMPGIVLDLLYRSNMFGSMRQLLSSWGITYRSAFEILRSQAGILMTMVSLFLTINIHIVERAEKKVFGIPRKELFKEDDSKLYVWTRKTSCVSPVLFVIALNTYYCFTGYMLFLWCNAFLIMHFYKHRNSYGEKSNRGAVINKLKGCLQGEDVTLDEVMEYRMTLENIGSSAVVDGNWLELEKMYYSLLESSRYYNAMNRYMLSYYYNTVIFWNYNKNRFFSIQMLKRYMQHIDLYAAKEDNIPDWEWPVLWGMLIAACQKAEEEELSILLGWFLDFAERSRAVRQGANYELPVSVLKEQAGMLSILSEYRLRYSEINDSYLVLQMMRIWDYGKVSIKNCEYDSIEQLYNMNETDLENDRILIGDIVKDLKSDVLNHSKISIITNL